MALCTKHEIRRETHVDHPNPPKSTGTMIIGCVDDLAALASGSMSAVAEPRAMRLWRLSVEADGGWSTDPRGRLGKSIQFHSWTT